MAGVTSAFVSAVLPVLSIAAVGSLLWTACPVDVGPLNTATLYVFLPALAAYSLLSSRLAGDLLRFVVTILAFSAPAFAASVAVGHDRLPGTAIRLPGFMFPRDPPSNMSDATKIVLATIGIAAALSIGIIGQHLLA